MADLRRIPVAWSGATGLPGVSVFYGPFGVDAGADLVTFFNAIKAFFTSGLTWQIPVAGDGITDSTGLITGSWTAGTGGTVVATGAGTYAAGCGAYVNWGTSTIIGGRRLKGRTFLAPLVSSCYDSGGTITNANLTTMQTAASALAASTHLVIWHRPTSPGGVNGSSGTVTSGVLPDQVTSLKTRRR